MTGGSARPRAEFFFEAAREAFEAAWRDYLPKRSETDFQAWRRRLARFLRMLRPGPPACAKSEHSEHGMKHQRHFGSGNDVALREVARISTLISDLDRVVRILDSDIATEEERARVSDPFDAAYPILARTLAARRDNLNDTIAALERRLVSLLERTEQAVPA